MAKREEEEPLKRASVVFGRTLIYEVRSVCNKRRKRLEGSGTVKSWQNYQNRLSKSSRRRLNI